MSEFRAYNRTLLAPLGVLLAAIAATAVYVQPLSGELTRLGGYLENDYGWNAPQQRFVTPQFRSASSLREYDRYHDVVVLGDSFSQDLARGWQNHLVARTGWSVISFHMDLVPLDRLTGSAAWRRHPPKLLVFESVERRAIGRLARCTGADRPLPLAPAQPVLTFAAIDAPVTLQYRAGTTGYTAPVGVSTVVNYWRKAAARALQRDDTEVRRFELSRGGLFSARNDRHLLVFERDVALRAVTGEQVDTARCALLEMQHAIERDGETAFLALVFPDKTSTYAAHIAGAGPVHRGIAAALERTPGLSVAALTERFAGALDDGVVDLYLPNDTHCGHAGYRIAAEAALDALVRRGVAVAAQRGGAVRDAGARRRQVAGPAWPPSGGRRSR